MCVAEGCFNCLSRDLRRSTVSILRGVASSREALHCRTPGDAWLIADVPGIFRPVALDYALNC